MSQPPDTSLLPAPIAAQMAGHLIPAADQTRRKSPSEAAEEFFFARVSNKNTQECYIRDAKQFASWCRERGLTLDAITPVHMSAYRDQLVKDGKEPATIKRQLSALRMLFSHMVATGAMPYNPAREVRTEPIRRVEGKTQALSPEQMHELFASFERKSKKDNTPKPLKLIDLRDRALIGVMAYTFCRVSAACRLTPADYIDLGRTTLVRLHEKGGVGREIPCHPKLAEYLDAWLKASAIAGSTPMFQTFTGPAHDRLSGRPVSRDEALQMVKRRLKRAGLPTLFTNHSFRATGITTFLENGGQLETAQRIAGHADSRTTKGYDRRATRLELAEIVRVTY